MLVGLLGLALGGYGEPRETKEVPHSKATELV
jgi:hypothetical protein